MKAKEFITRNMRPQTTSGTAKPGAVDELKSQLLSAKEDGTKFTYEVIDKIMQKISKSHNITGQQLHDEWMHKYHQWPDNWIKEQ